MFGIPSQDDEPFKEIECGNCKQVTSRWYLPECCFKNKSELFYGGLTKREYFAAMAMQGMLTNHVLSQAYADSGPEFTPKWFKEFHAANAIAMADTLIKELEKQND